MKLIGSLASPYVRKVRVVMAEKKLDYELVLEDVWDTAATVHENNPLGKVPCLIMDDGGVMFDSRVIVEYLDTLTPVCKLIPMDSSRERAEVKCWEALADGILDAAVLIRLEKMKRSLAQQSEDWVALQRNKVVRGLSTLSTGLADKSFFSSGHYTLADVAVGCTLGWLSFRFPEIAWQTDYPNLLSFFNKLMERPSFLETCPE